MASLQYLDPIAVAALSADTTVTNNNIDFQQNIALTGSTANTYKVNLTNYGKSAQARFFVTITGGGTNGPTLEIWDAALATPTKISNVTNTASTAKSGIIHLFHNGTTWVPCAPGTIA